MSARSPEVSRSCWSCRCLSGGALICSAGWVYLGARASLHRGAARGTLGGALQLALSAGLALWGVVVLVDPWNKNQQKPTGS